MAAANPLASPLVWPLIKASPSAFDQTLAGLTGMAPSIYADFANQRQLPAGSAFGRASVGRTANIGGVILNDAINVPRFPYNPNTKRSLGFLSENSGTNLIRNNNELGTPTTGTGSTSTTVWTQVGGTATVSSDAKYTGPQVVSFTEDTSTGAHGILTPLPTAPGADQNQMFSVELKAGTATRLAFGRKNGFLTANDEHIKVDLANGTIISSNGTYSPAPAIENLGDGWYRLTFGALVTTGTGFRCVSVQTMNGSDQTTSFAGTGRTFLMACPQVEVGGIASTFTGSGGGATATRGFDNARIADLATTGYSAAGGTLIFDFIPLTLASSGGAYYLGAFSDGTESNIIRASLTATTGFLRLGQINGGVSGLVNTTNTVNLGVQNRAVITWRPNRFTGSLNGGDLAIVEPAQALPTVTRFDYAKSPTSFHLYGPMAMMAFIPQEISPSLVKQIAAM